MSRKYKFGDNDKLYFISFSVVYWIDVFVRDEYRNIVVESWRFCQQNKGLEIYGWCIMTSHVHMIVGTKNRPLDKIIGEMKSFISTRLRRAIAAHTGESRKEWMVWMMERAGKKNGNNNDWQFWQQNNKPLEIPDANMFYQKLNYIHHNPVEAGFVRKGEDWKYSSAGDFYGMPGFIELSYIS